MMESRNAFIYSPHSISETTRDVMCGGKWKTCETRFTELKWTENDMEEKKELQRVDETRRRIESISSEFFFGYKLISHDERRIYPCRRIVKLYRNSLWSNDKPSARDVMSMSKATRRPHSRVKCHNILKTTGEIYIDEKRRLMTAHHPIISYYIPTDSPISTHKTRPRHNSDLIQAFREKPINREEMKCLQSLLCNFSYFIFFLLVSACMVVGTFVMPEHYKTCFRDAAVLLGISLRRALCSEMLKSTESSSLRHSDIIEQTQGLGNYIYSYFQFSQFYKIVQKRVQLSLTTLSHLFMASKGKK